jgi:hypothetical protein
MWIAEPELVATLHKNSAVTGWVAWGKAACNLLLAVYEVALRDPRRITNAAALRTTQMQV